MTHLRQGPGGQTDHAKLIEEAERIKLAGDDLGLPLHGTAILAVSLATALKSEIARARTIIKKQHSALCFFHEDGIHDPNATEAHNIVRADVLREALALTLEEPKP